LSYDAAFIQVNEWNVIVSIATGYRLDSQGFRVQVLVEEGDFSSLHHLDSYPMGSRDPLPRNKVTSA
jgi:hypothetical protein